MKKSLYLTALLLCSYSASIKPSDVEESNVVKFIKEKGDDIFTNVITSFKKQQKDQPDDLKKIEPSNFKFKVISEFKQMFNVPPSATELADITNYFSVKANTPLPGSQPSTEPKAIKPVYEKKIKIEQESTEETVPLKDQFLKTESAEIIKKFIRDDKATVDPIHIKRIYSAFLKGKTVESSDQLDNAENYLIEKLQEQLDAKLKELGKEPGQKVLTQNKNAYFNFDISESDRKKKSYNELYPAYLFLNLNGNKLIDNYISNIKTTNIVAKYDFSGNFFNFCKYNNLGIKETKESQFTKCVEFIQTQLQNMLNLKILETQEQKGTTLQTSKPTQQKISESFDFRVNGETITLKDKSEKNYRAKAFLNQFGKILVNDFVSKQTPSEKIDKLIKDSLIYKTFLRLVAKEDSYDDDSSEEEEDFNFIVAQIKEKVLAKQPKTPVLPLKPSQPSTSKVETSLEDMDIATIISKLESGQLSPKRGAEALKKLQSGIDSADKAAKKIEATQAALKKELDDKIAKLQGEHELSLTQLTAVHKAEKEAFEKQLKDLQQEVDQSKSTPAQKQEALKVTQHAEISVGTDPIIENLVATVVDEKSAQSITTATADAATQMTDLIPVDQLSQQVTTGMLTPQQVTEMLLDGKKQIQEEMDQKLQHLKQQYNLTLEMQESIHRISLEAQEESYREQMNLLASAIKSSKASQQEQQSALKDLADFKENISSELFTESSKQYGQQLAQTILKTGQSAVTQQVLTKALTDENIKLQGLDDRNNMAYLMGYVQMKVWILQGK